MSTTTVLAQTPATPIPEDFDVPCDTSGPVDIPLVSNFTVGMNFIDSAGGANADLLSGIPISYAPIGSAVVMRMGTDVFLRFTLDPNPGACQSASFNFEIDTSFVNGRGTFMTFPKTINIVDSEPPTITSTMYPDGDTTTMDCPPPGFFAPMVTIDDNCLLSSAVDTTRDTMYVAANCFSVLYTIMTTDSCENQSNVYTHTLLVQDTIKPSFLMSAGDTLQVDTLVCAEDTISRSLTVAGVEGLLRAAIDTATLNCSDNYDSLWVEGPTPLADPTCSNHFSRTVFLALGDSCNGWTDTLAHHLIVQDTVGPYFHIGDMMTATNDTLNRRFACIEDTVDREIVRASLQADLRDVNCQDGGDTVIIIFDEVLGGDAGVPGTCPLNLRRTITYVAMDSCMNADTLTIVDTVPGPQPDLGPDRFSCFDSWTFNSSVSLCEISDWEWEVVEGLGMLIDTANHARAEYCPIGVEELGDTVVIAYHATPRNTDCEVVSDTVRLLIQVPCFNCLEEINFACQQEVRISDIIQKDMDSCQESTFELSLIDKVGRPLDNPLPPGFTGEFWAFVTSKWTGQFCEALGIVSDKETCQIYNNLDTAVWCVDHFLEIDPEGVYYRDSLGLRPYAVEDCSGDTIWADLRGEWTKKQECGDTAELVIREWSYTTKAGNTCVGYDSIAVIRLPDLADYIIAPQKDTVACVLVNDPTYEPEISYLSWKQLVGIHSDTTWIRYPKVKVTGIAIQDMLDKIASIADVPLRDSTIKVVEDIAVVRRWDKYTSQYTDYNLFDIVNNTDGLFREEPYDSDTVYSYHVQLYDRILTHGGSYLEVDSNWLYKGGSHGFWVDLSVPYVEVNVTDNYCDEWEESCGIQVLLPNRPYQSDTCIVFCLDQLAEHESGCLEFVHDEEKDLGGSCPKVKKRHVRIKQLCVATGVDPVPNDCDYVVDKSGVIGMQSNPFSGGGLEVEIEQWTLYIDTLAPLVGEEKDRVFYFNTDEHYCHGEITIPGIYVKDQCSGVKAVKATVGEGNFWVQLTDEDGDGYWEQTDTDRSISLACGDAERVHYELMDSCHNVRELYRHWIQMQDITAPVVLTDDTINVSLAGKEIGVSVDAFDIGSADNCGIARKYVRRLDWITACGVDVCVEELENITTEKELEDFLEEKGYTYGLSDGKTEQYYADQYEWLDEEGDFCEGGDARELMLRGWQEDIKDYWRANCLPTDEHGNSLFPSSDAYHIGGGWGDKVLFCCEDACEEVLVEILVIDKNCNYTKGWTVVRVNDKSPVSKACDFEDIAISCSAYAGLYADVMEAAATGDEAMLDSLDVLLGDLKKGWRSADNMLVDFDGELIDKEHTVYTTKCSLEVVTEKRFDTLHDGEVVWITDTTARKVLYQEEVDVDLGGVYQLCGSTCERDVWIELDDCGLGKVTRRWTVYGGCDPLEGHSAPPIVMTQTIYVQQECGLDKYSFSVPDDTLICGDLIYDLSGNLVLDAGSLTYDVAGDLGSCRQLGIGFEDELFSVAGEEGFYKVHRLWKVSDWCSGEELECVQKIIIQTSGCEQESAAENTIEPMALEVSRAKQTEQRASDSDTEFRLYQNRPNPFVEESSISFFLPESGEARLTLFDVSGRILWETREVYPAGHSTEVIRVSELGNRIGGVIYYQLETATHTATKQMVLLR